MQAPFLLRLRKAFSNKKGFLQRVLDKGSFFRRGALSNKNRGFTERFLDADPLFTKAKEGSQQQEMLFAEIPRQRLLFYKGGAPSNKNIGFTERFLDAGPLFTKAKAFSNKKGFLQRFPDKGSFFTWGGPQQQEQKLRRELP